MPVQIIADPGACWRIPNEPWSASWERMEEMVDIAADAGAQGLKAQLLRAGMYGDGTEAARLVSDYEVPDEWLPRLAEACDARGIAFLCTVYRAEDVAVVDPYVKRFKVAGFDATNTALVNAVRSTGKPLIVTLSLGNSMYLRGFEDVTYLHGVSQYPTPPENMNMRWLKDATRDREPWLLGSGLRTDKYGLSDHSIGNTAAIMAAAYGATVIEKHIRHEDTLPSNPDYPTAASPAEFRSYVAAIREAELMLGTGEKRVMPGEWSHFKYDSATGRRAGD